MKECLLKGKRRLLNNQTIQNIITKEKTMDKTITIPVDAANYNFLNFLAQDRGEDLDYLINKIIDDYLSDAVYETEGAIINIDGDEGTIISVIRGKEEWFLEVKFDDTVEAYTMKDLKVVPKPPITVDKMEDLIGREVKDKDGKKGKITKIICDSDNAHNFYVDLGGNLGKYQKKDFENGTIIAVDKEVQQYILKYVEGVVIDPPPVVDLPVEEPMDISQIVGAKIQNREGKIGTLIAIKKGSNDDYFEIKYEDSMVKTYIGVAFLNGKIKAVDQEIQKLIIDYLNENGPTPPLDKPQPITPPKPATPSKPIRMIYDLIGRGVKVKDGKIGKIADIRYDMYARRIFEIKFGGYGTFKYTLEDFVNGKTTAIDEDVQKFILHFSKRTEKDLIGQEVVIADYKNGKITDIHCIDDGETHIFVIVIDGKVVKEYSKKDFEDKKVRAKDERAQKYIFEHIHDRDDIYMKAWRRIPKWARSPWQYNHKILAAYFEAQRLYGTVYVRDMHRICSDRNDDRFYVPTFESNYTQMTFDRAHSHGKVFEERFGIVTLWDKMEERILEYKNCFEK